MNHVPTTRRFGRSRAALWLAGMVWLGACPAAWGAQRYELPEFASGHEVPTSPTHPQTPSRPRAQWQEVADVAVLAVALSVAAWLALRARSRRAMLVLAIVSLVYFGFYRGGCVCPIGAIQNVALALGDPAYAAPFTVVLFFVLPLLFALLFGRVFCGGVCPLGAIQDLVHVKTVRLPKSVEKALSILPFVYLGLAVLYAATGTMFVVCKYDPFVGFFRMWHFDPFQRAYPQAGADAMLIVGGLFLLLGMFVGRPYCRFLCPYGALLGVCSRVAWRKVSITPDECTACTLCHEACPFGAIEPPTPEGVMEP